MGSIIVVEGLVKKFGGFTAVDHVDLDVKKGEIFGLLGPNGAGKTNIIHMMLSLLVPTSGKILIDGFRLGGNSEKIKQMIGLMTQETVVEEELTAEENLEIFAKLYHIPEKEIPKKVAEALKEADIVSFKNAKASTFSGGMKRRLGLVRAMIQNPKVLVLDEPTTGLDVQNRVSMWSRIRELNRGGTTVILTTQYLEEADMLCDRIAIIDHGRIIASGTPTELKRLAGTGNILEITAKQTDVEKIAKALKSKFSLSPTVNGDKITAELSGKHRTTFVRVAIELERLKLEPVAISTHLPTLDDVFIKLTGATLRDTLSEGTSQFGRLRTGR